MSINHEEAKNMIHEHFKHYDPCGLIGPSERLVGFHIHIKGKRISPEIQKALESHGFDFSDWNTSKIQLMRSYKGEGELVYFNPQRFEHMEELAETIDFLKKFISSYELDRVHFNDRFLLYCKGSFPQVTSLYEKVKLQEIQIEEWDARPVFSQLDACGHFLLGIYGDVDRGTRHARQVHLHPIVFGDDKIGFKRIEFMNRDSWSDKALNIVFETEIVKIDEGAFASVFKFPSLVTLYQYFGETQVYVDGVKSMDGKTNVQKIYLRNKGREDGNYIFISCDPKIDVESNLNPFMTVGYCDTITRL